MINTGEPIELGVLEDMAVTTAIAIREVPEAFFEEPMLLDGLMTPIRTEAEHLLGRWLCCVTASHALGCNITGEDDNLAGENEVEFVGRLAAVELKVMRVEPLLAYGIEEGLMPSLVFSTMDDRQFDGEVAQMYNHVAVPLLGPLLLISPSFHR